MSVTQASLLGDTFGSSASGTIPVGGIIMWSGSVTSIPTGWSLCNGANGTPDLQDKFIVGAGSGYTVAETGGEAFVTLIKAQMPVHNHDITDNGHTHSITEYDDDFALAGGGASAGFNKPAYEEQSRTTSSETTGITIDDAGGLFGTTLPHENRPPYYALAFIMRVS